MTGIKPSPGVLLVAPCPCCGSEDLDVGLRACLLYGVQCNKCRIKVEEWVPNSYPKGVARRGATGLENSRRLRLWTVKQAIKRWNRRPEGKPPLLEFSDHKVGVRD